MARRRVTFVELPVFPGVVPLASGYMEAYGRRDAVVATEYQFAKLSMPVRTPIDEIVSTLDRAEADVYAFSCYVWNTALVRRVVEALRHRHPNAYFILGGPQVMHQGTKYLAPTSPRVVICNGEGERTMTAFLREITAGRPDFRAVRGLSFYGDGDLITTEAEPRISDLGEIPSPFLDGLFDGGRYRWMLLETNRGCPFKCNYCYWGAAIGGKVYKYGEDRIRQELEWISKSGCWYLFLADANWGMLKRDVDLSRLIVDYRQRNGAPNTVYFCGSKNTPDRVAEITLLFDSAGMLTCQSVALQTLNPETLKRVNRENIKTSAYTQIQRALNERGVSSFVEMIWPLPGETLSSFQQGLAALCESGADSFIVYPLLLMNNVELTSKRDEYGLVTVRDPDPNSEAEMVVQTNEVTRAEYNEGMWYVYALTSLHTLRGLWHLAEYLHSRGEVSYRDLFTGFLRYNRSLSDSCWMEFCERSTKAGGHAAFENIGELVHLVLHEHRTAFDALLEGFVTSQPFWADPTAQALFEVDLVHRPYIYVNTPLLPKARHFAHIDVSVHSEGYRVCVPSHVVPHLQSCGTLDGTSRDANWFTVVQRRSQLPYMPGKPRYENYLYCHDMSQRMRNVLPRWWADSRLASAIG